MAIKFFFQSVKVSLNNRNSLKAFIAEIFKKEGKKAGNLNYIFCTDEYLLTINKEYLQHNFYTDIITFDISLSKESIDGEIYISTERVKENAATYQQTFKTELHRVIFHGALHLCGYKDKSKTETLEMRAAERRYLDMYFG